jgi:hypothetical protein
MHVWQKRVLNSGPVWAKRTLSLSVRIHLHVDHTYHRRAQASQVQILQKRLLQEGNSAQASFFARS